MKGLTLTREIDFGLSTLDAESISGAQQIKIAFSGSQGRIRIESKLLSLDRFKHEQDLRISNSDGSGSGSRMPRIERLLEGERDAYQAKAEAADSVDDTKLINPMSR